MAGLSWSRLGFFSKGETAASLYAVGKVPWLKERLASLAIMSEKTESQDLIREVGIKSSGEDLAGMTEMIALTSEGVTILTDSRN